MEKKVVMKAFEDIEINDTPTVEIGRKGSIFGVVVESIDEEDGSLFCIDSDGQDYCITGSDCILQIQNADGTFGRK